MQEHPTQIYQRALEASVNDQYDNALALFQQVQQLVPNFPFIVSNINQCQSLARAHNQYLRAIDLMNQGQWIRALFHLEYTERSLQQDYKNCRDLMWECRQRYWFDQLQNQPSFAPQSQLNDQIPILHNIYVEFHQARLRQPVTQNQPATQQFDNEEDINNLAQETQQIDRVVIFYLCTKNTNKCPQKNNKQPFNHSSCQRTAYFDAMGMITCESGCQTYSIYDALFSCTNQEVTNRNDQQQQTNLESITTITQFADFVENCFTKSSLTQARQANFRVLLPTFVLPEMTRKGLI